MFPIPLQKLNDQQRHDYILQNYVLNKRNSADSRRYKRDIDIIKEHHRFVWDESAEAEQNNFSWEERLARRYYDKLFKEYCLADLQHYKHNKIALRWRVEAEVISGKGQFQCGSRKCNVAEDLRSWEVNFAYLEQGVKKNVLVKLRLCPEHSAQLNYRSQKRELKRLSRQQKKELKHNKRQTAPKNKDSHEAAQKPIAEILQSSEETINSEPLPAATEPAPVVLSDDNGVWSQKLQLENEQDTRETEFERYLEDLLF